MFAFHLILLCFVLFAVCRAENVSPRVDSSLTGLVSDSSTDAKELWKRRKGGGGSDSDSSSGSGSSSDSSGDSGSYDDDDDDDYTYGQVPEDDNVWYSCTRPMNKTRPAENTLGYGGWYTVGNGQKNSTQGGYTAKGSGSAPHWDNSTGSWSYNKYPSYLDPPETLSYTGGAAVPYLSGKVSPNGVSPRKFTNLPYTPDLEEYPSGYECTIPNTNYAYKYEAEFEYTESDDDSSHSAPIYCCCALGSLCGCDDFHQNSSFVLAMLEREMASVNPLNSTSVCAIDIEGETTVLVSGTLEDGSTKADGETESLTETISTTGLTRCMRATGAPDEVSTAGMRVLGGPSQRAFVLAWVGTVGAGVLVGMGVVLL
ncbi:hypothetical protein ASPVEDRAFT_34970 [Aspergillus versicolor CBS 583.65]|uniref:DUF7732 domain-containing protein n=1 Tax=Aspergillus versicolor CBS 583.65 TaxID=1036611 RepID=A0A1L9Q529_ASPVE|nr:uncharacterized protein ASPVEDRAFT_34970 [Aspergillus versicolor CBS 583.65]OJJ08841.1 hypothetical protein ASPVEDRAFT_34970 [Aspergillus versicolor CBS 583.65]